MEQDCALCSALQISQSWALKLISSMPAHFYRHDTPMARMSLSESTLGNAMQYLNQSHEHLDSRSMKDSYKSQISRARLLQKDLCSTLLLERQ